MNRNEIKECLTTININIDEQELDDIYEKVNEIDQYLALLNKVNTEYVEGMSFPFALTSNYLREDEVDDMLTQEEALANANEVEDGYVKYVKVV
jgi:aspartyl-tRNA(Asn)/glutamyl-tRNA(Gln) amidotransferase subunit C